MQFLLYVIFIFGKIYMVDVKMISDSPSSRTSLISTITQPTEESCIRNRCLLKVLKLKQFNALNGVIKIEFHAMLHALYDLLVKWGCKPTLLINEPETGFNSNNLFHYFNQRAPKCQPELGLLKNEYEKPLCQSLLRFRYFVYIGHRRMLSFFANVSDCPGIFKRMRTWIVIADYSHVIHFSSFQLNKFVKLPTSQVTFFVPSMPHTQRPTSPNLYVEYGMASRVDLYDVFYSPSTLKTEAILFAYWTPKLRLYYIQRIYDERQLRGRNVRLVTIRTMCPTVCVGGVNENKILPSYFVDLADIVQKFLQVNYYTDVAAEAKFGTADANGSFNGLVGQLQRGEYEFAVMVISIIEERKFAINYGAGIINGDMRIVIRRPLPLVPPTIYVLPFQPSVWLTTLASLILIYILVLVIHKVNVAFNLEQEDPGSDADQTYKKKLKLDFFDQMSEFNSLAAKVVMISLFVAALLVFTYYTSILTAVFAYRDIKLPFQSMEELASNKEYKVMVIKDTVYHNALKSATEGPYKRIWSKILSGGERNLISNYSVGFSEIARRTKYAFLATGRLFQNVVKKNCSIMFLPHNYMKEIFHVPFRMDFPYIKIYTNSFQRLREAGIHTRLEKLYIISEYNKCEELSVSQTLELAQIYALFAFLLGSWFISLLAMALERLVYLHNRTN